jgi:hypothetical protein
LFYNPIIAQNTETIDVIVTSNMTVLKILPAGKSDSVTRIIFQTSQRIYKLPLKAKPVYLLRLKESLEKHVPVLIKRASEKSDIILSVNKVKKQ